MAKRAFVLGGTGQIGRGVARRLLERGWDVTVAARSFAADAPQTRFVQLDRDEGLALQTDFDALIDIVPFELAHAKQLLALRGRVGTVVAVSSASVYADTAGRTVDEAREHGFPELPVPIPETQSTVEPGDATYSTRKRAIEVALLEQDTIPATVLRPCAVHGPHAKDHVREWFFVKRILDGRRTVLLAYRGESRFHTSSAANVAELVTLACEHPGTRVLNAGDPDPPTTKEISRALQSALDAELVELLVPDAPREARNPWAVPWPLVVDMSAAARELGYRPVTTYEAAVADTARWLVDERPPLDPYMRTFFDYAAEDAFVRGLAA